MLLTDSSYNSYVYTVEEASKLLGFNVSHIRRLLRDGKLKGKKWGRDWMVEDFDLQEVKEARSRQKTHERRQ